MASVLVTSGPGTQTGSRESPAPNMTEKGKEEQTMKRSRKNHTSLFEVKLALEVLREEETMAEMASHYEGHPSQVRT